MTTFVFPGQGSQTKAMGGNLFDEFSDFTAIANQILGYSIKTLCLEDPAAQLNQTLYTQPAMYVVNALHYFKKIQETHQLPNFVAGHSLGEYNALLAAEVFDFATGLKLVQKRGELMDKATGGGMAAVVGLSTTDIEKILRESQITNITMANYNSPIQTILSGSKEDIQRLQPLFEKSGVFIPLKVSGAFHSPYMNSAQQQFSQFLNQFTFAPSKIPVIANVNAKPYLAPETHHNLSAQLTQPVQWQKSIEYLLAQGENEFIEVGTGNVLTGLIKRIKANIVSV